MQRRALSNISNSKTPGKQKGVARGSLLARKKKAGSALKKSRSVLGDISNKQNNATFGGNSGPVGKLKIMKKKKKKSRGIGGGSGRLGVNKGKRPQKERLAAKKASGSKGVDALAAASSTLADIENDNVPDIEPIFCGGSYRTTDIPYKGEVDVVASGLLDHLRGIDGSSSIYDDIFSAQEDVFDDIDKVDPKLLQEDTIPSII